MGSYNYQKREPKFSITCEVCNSSFKSTQSYTKTCSTECRNKRNQTIAGRYVVASPNKDIPTATVGAITELIIATDLMKKGYAVFRAMSLSCFCDLIAIKGDQVWRVEARTAYKNKISGTLGFVTKLNGDANCYGLYERNSGEVTYLNLDRTPLKEIK